MAVLAGGAGTEHFLMALLQAFWVDSSVILSVVDRAHILALHCAGRQYTTSGDISPKWLRSEPTMSGHTGCGGLTGSEAMSRCQG